MTGLIILLILIPIVFFILLLTILGRTSEQQKLTESLYDRIKFLSEDIAALTKEVRNLKQPVETKNIIIEERPVQKVFVPPPIAVAPTEEKKEDAKPIFTPETKKQEWQHVIESKQEEIIIEKKESPRPFISSSKPETDLEKFIGENLLSKIGIAVLVLGISFFVKYAIDQNWIKEAGRVIIGLIAGGILIGIAHRIRNSYRSFSSVLMGGGLTVFYFTIAFAFHQYHLISQIAGFIIMVIITAFAVLLSLYYDRIELAILATIGGFITPFLVSTGQENYVALFTYLCILNSGLMVLAWFKRWPTINIIALFFTTIIYGSWLIKKMWLDSPVVVPYKDAMLFGTLFYLQFVTMNIVNNIREKKIFNAFDFIIVLSINFLFYIAAMVIFPYWNRGDYNGLFTASLGIFNLLLVLGFRQKKTIDPNFLALLTGLALTFISLAAPVQFKGNYVALFWAAEAVILFWLFQRTRNVQLKIASLIIAVLMLGSLGITWIQVYFSDHQLIPVLLNKGFSTTIAVSVSLFIYYKLMYKEADTFYLNSIRNQSIRDFLLGGFVVTLYLSGALEIFYQFNTRNNIESLYIIYLQLYTFLFAIIVLFSFKRSVVFPVFKFLFTILCLGLYLINININYDISLSLIPKDQGNLFFAHWIAVICLSWLLIDLVIYFGRTREKNWTSYLSAFAWISAISFILLLSVEIYQVNLWLNYQKVTWTWWENLYYKAGLSILWSICSFIMMWLGMQYKFRPLRIISLSLFTVTLVKLFTYDISNIPPGGKIAAFILLGILLLTVSFMYQRLKKIIIEDAEIRV
ncbi:MAG TPA: DUF2339 domain-containing protein [Chitinophagaceae bacterium]|nr:DUF2339 domain-containing protein [Chitinophagaceae bacterium]